eukprot:69344-Chlamydomonas_euryale.AAC.1
MRQMWPKSRSLLRSTCLLSGMTPRGDRAHHWIGSAARGASPPSPAAHARGRQAPRLCHRVGQGWQDVGIVEDALRARRSPAAGPEEGPKLVEGDVGDADPAVDGRPLRAVLLHNRAD